MSLYLIHIFIYSKTILSKQLLTSNHNERLWEQRSKKVQHFVNLRFKSEDGGGGGEANGQIKVHCALNKEINTTNIPFLACSVKRLYQAYTLLVFCHCDQ